MTPHAFCHPSARPSVLAPPRYGDNNATVIHSVRVLSPQMSVVSGQLLRDFGSKIVINGLDSFGETIHKISTRLVVRLSAHADSLLVGGRTVQTINPDTAAANANLKDVVFEGVKFTALPGSAETVLVSVIYPAEVNVRCGCGCGCGCGSVGVVVVVWVWCWSGITLSPPRADMHCLVWTCTAWCAHASRFLVTWCVIMLALWLVQNTDIQLKMRTCEVGQVLPTNSHTCLTCKPGTYVLPWLDTNWP